MHNNISVALNSPLFYGMKKPHFLTTDSIIKLCRRLNNELSLGRDINGIYGKFRAHNLRKLFSSIVRMNITNVVVNKDRFSELDILSIFMGHKPPNLSNADVYNAVEDEDTPDNYLRKNYEALIPYLTINKKQSPVKKDNKNLKGEIMKIKESVDILLNNGEQLSFKS